MRIPDALYSQFGRLGLVRAGLILSIVALAGSCRHPPADLSDLRSANTAFMIGDFESAVEDYTSAIEDAENASPPFFHMEAVADRGLSRLRLATTRSAEDNGPQLRRAAEDFRSVLAAGDPRNRSIFLRCLEGLAIAEELAGNVTLAVDLYREIVDFARAEDAGYLLLSRRRLGWARLDVILDSSPRAVPDTSVRYHLDQALVHFEHALSISPDDPASLLGKGICLYRQRQNERAQEALHRSLELTRGLGLRNPSAHFHLALSLEDTQGREAEITDHLVRAVEQDPDRKLRGLYSHLLRVLPEVLTPEDPQFPLALGGILAFRANDPEHWTRTEALCDRYVRDLSRSDSLFDPAAPEQNYDLLRLVYFGRALSRSRLGRIDDALADLGELRDDPRFGLYLDRTFPPNSQRADQIYGRLKALTESGSRHRVEEWVLDGSFLPETEELRGADSLHAFKIQRVVGGVLLDRWRSLIKENPSLATHPRTREQYLYRAQKAFKRYLKRYPDDLQVRLHLGEIADSSGQTGEAVNQYVEITKHDLENLEAFANLQRLHSSGSLSPLERRDVWSRLQKYTGDDVGLRTYIRENRQRLLSERTAYCAGCGRKLTSGEITCLFCGRRSGSREGPQGKGRRSGSREGPQGK